MALLSALGFLNGVRYSVERPAGFIVLWLQDPTERAGLGLSDASVALLAAACRCLTAIGAPLFGAMLDNSDMPLRIASAALVLNGLLRFGVFLSAATRPGQPEDGSGESVGTLEPIGSGSGLDGNLDSQFSPPPPWLGLGSLLLCSGLNFAQLLDTWVATATLQVLKGREQYYGRIRLWGGMGYACGSALTGCLADALHTSVVVFAVSPVACVLSVALALAYSAKAEAPLPAPSEATTTTDTRGAATDDASQSATAQPTQPTEPDVGTRGRGASEGLCVPLRRVAHVVCAPRIALFLWLAFALAFCFCAVETYVLARAAEVGGSPRLMGVMQVVMIASEVPTLFFSNFWLRAGAFNVRGRPLNSVS